MKQLKIDDFKRQIDALRRQGETMENAFDQGEAARTKGIPMDANPWFDAMGNLIHFAALDWAAGWRNQNEQRQAQPDLFDLEPAQ